MPYELKSKNQAAVLRLGENGLPEHWRLSGGDGLTVYRAEPRAWAVVRRKADRCERTCPLCAETIRKQEDRLLVTFSVSWEQQPAAAVSLSFAAEESGFSLAWEGAEERDGYALLEITVPALVFSAPEEHAQFLHGEHRGGYLADLDTMDENAEIHGEDRFGGYPNASVLPVLCLFRERTMCVMEVQGYVCRTLLDARKETGISLGVSALLHRLAVTGYRVENGVYRIHLEHAAEIGIDTAAGNWYASYEGVRILENDRLTCPLGRGTIAFYAHEDCTLETKLPARAHAAGASACLEEGSQPHPFEEENGVLRVSVKACVPVIVTLAQDQ